MLIAALAAGDVDGRERSAAERLATDCGECAALLLDLRSIAQATRTLPVRPRPSGLDFRLTQDDARRLGARGWRKALQELAGARFGFTRPLAVGLTTLGLVGLLSASLPGGIGFGAPTSQVLSNVGAPVGVAGALAPSAASASGGAGASNTDRSAPGGGSESQAVAGTSPAASGGSAPSVASASSAPQPTASGVAGASVPPRDSGASPSPSASGGTYGAQIGGPSASAKTGIGSLGQGTDQTGGPASGLQSQDHGGTPSPILILSILAFVTGVLLLVGQWVGDRLLVR